MIRVQDRDALLKHLLDKGIEAKVHYPIPVHLQKGAEYLGYKKGDFPQCESDCESIVTLPAHQHLSPEAIDYTADQVRSFYGKKSRS